jgi:hypothetical protein
MRGWKRLSDCPKCGEPRCVQNTNNPRMFYCFRYNITFFENGNAKKKEKKPLGLQKELNFGENSNYEH